MTDAMKVLVGGVIFLIIGLVLSSTILSQAATSGSSANIGSFSGAQSMNDLVPFVYYAILVISAVGMIGMGAFGVVRARGKKGTR